MPTFTKATVKDAKKRKRRVEPEYIDYASIPGIIVFKTEAEFYNWQVYGTLKAPKGAK